MTSDVIILGAGAAGLEAARRLAGAGLTVELIEARERLGGRIHTVRPPGAPLAIELGAEFVHGRPAETWAHLRAARLGVYDVPDAHHVRETSGAIEAWPDFWERLETVLGGLAGVERDVPFTRYLETVRADEAAKRMARAYVEGFNAADAQKVSAVALAADRKAEEAVDATQLFRIDGGYARLVDHLAAALDPAKVRVRLGRVARRVEWSARGVEVVTESSAAGREAFRAARAVVTLPVGVLKAPAGSAGAVEFAPELAGKRAALARIEMGPVVKAVMRFRRPFWEEGLPAAKDGLEDLSFLHANDTAFPTWWTTLPFRTSVLTAWAGGPAAGALAGLGREELLGRAVASIASATGLSEAVVAGEVEAFEAYDWHADPYARGAYSYLAAGAGDAAERLGEPVEGTLFFAGEATHAGMSGTVAAALASGARAAGEVLAARG
jgi:monoamine oxidase